MFAHQFTTRRAVVGWIWLIYGFICMKISLAIPGGSYESCSGSLVIATICGLAWVVLSTLAKGLRITKRYNENIILMSFVSAVGAMFFFSLATDKYHASTMEEDMYFNLRLAYIIWIFGWFVVDILDLWNAPKAKEHPLRH